MPGTTANFGWSKPISTDLVSTGDEVISSALDAIDTKIAADAAAFTETVQDLVGAMATDGTTVNFTYTDVAGTLTAEVQNLAAANLSDFAEAVRDRLGATLVQGSGITITVDDPGDTVTVASIVTQYTDEQARDAIGAALVAGSNIDITVNDGADTITIDVEALTAADIGDFAEAVDDRVAALLTQGTNITLTYNDGAGTLTIAAAGGGSGVRVEDEGGTVVAAATGINFAGAGVTVTDAGSNEALVTIPAGGVDLTAVPFVTTAASGLLSAESVLGADVIKRGVLADRPAAGLAGRLYDKTDDDQHVDRDNGASWDTFAIKGLVVQDDNVQEGAGIRTLDFGTGLDVAVTGTEAVVTAPNQGVTVQEEGTPLATAGTTFNFVGTNLTASGTGATKTITLALPTPPQIIRVVSVAYAATVTPNADTTDVLNIAALTGGLTVANPTGTPVDGQVLRIRYLQDATGGRTVAYGANFAFGTDVTLAMTPSAANAKWERLFAWHAGDGKWRNTAIVRGF